MSIEDIWLAACDGRPDGEAPVECPDCHSLHTLTLVVPARDTADAAQLYAAAPYYQCENCGYAVSTG